MDAERNYELINQDFQTNDLAYPALMMAGRAAVARQDYKDAREYFRTLEADTNCPTDLQVQAAFAHGDALMLMDSTVTNDPLHNFSVATNEFASIIRLNPTNEAAGRAWGKIGDCYLQLSSYDAATNAYAQVLSTNMQANSSLRSEAQVGIGMVLEKKRRSPPAPTKMLCSGWPWIITWMCSTPSLEKKQRTRPGCRKPPWRRHGWRNRCRNGRRHSIITAT